MNPPSLQARKQQLVRDAIWEAAIDLFAERGFDATTVDEIAAAAGVSPRSFFRYFASKADLIADTMLAYQRRMTELIDGCPAGLTLWQVMEEAVVTMAEEAAGYPRTQKIIEVTARFPAARAAQLSRMAEAQAQVAGALARRAQPEERELAPRVLAGFATTFVEAILEAWYSGGHSDLRTLAASVFAVARPREN